MYSERSPNSVFAQSRQFLEISRSRAAVKEKAEVEDQVYTEARRTRAVVREENEKEVVRRGRDL